MSCVGNNGRRFMQYHNEVIYGPTLASESSTAKLHASLQGRDAPACSAWSRAKVRPGTWQVAGATGDRQA